MQGICVYVLEYMFTLEKMLNTSTLMCKSSKLSVEHSNSGLSFHTVRLVLYIGCSGPVIRA